MKIFILAISTHGKGTTLWAQSHNKHGPHKLHFWQINFKLQ